MIARTVRVKPATAIRGVLLLTLLLLAWGPAAPGETVYGAGLGEAETVSIQKLLSEPESWVGKRVRVEPPDVTVGDGERRRRGGAGRYHRHR